MIRLPITQFNNNISKYIALAQSGESFYLTKRSKVMAVLTSKKKFEAHETQR